MGQVLKFYIVYDYDWMSFLVKKIKIVIDIKGVPRNMTVGELFKMSSSIICQVVCYQRE